MCNKGLQVERTYVEIIFIPSNFWMSSFTGLHPRILTEGFDIARTKALEVLDSIKIPIEVKREYLLDVSRTSLKTKVCLNQS